jgi:hypothetical protein
LIGSELLEADNALPALDPCGLKKEFEKGTKQTRGCVVVAVGEQLNCPNTEVAEMHINEATIKT